MTGPKAAVAPLKQPAAAPAKTPRRRAPHSVARQLTMAYFIMAAAPLLVFLVFDQLGVGGRVLGSVIHGDPANGILAAAAAIAVALVLGIRMGRRITAPLAQLTAAADALSSGEVPDRVALGRDDEFGHLANAFNVMADRLTKTISVLNERLQGLSTELFYLSSLGSTLSEGSDPMGDLRRVTPRLRTMLAGDFAWLYLTRGSEPRLIAYDGDTGAASVVGVEETARAVLADRRPADGGYSSMGGRLTTAARAAWYPVASAIAVPLMQQGEAVGVVIVGSLQVHRFAEEHRLLLASAATQVAFMLSFSEVFGEVEDGYLQTVTSLCGSLEEKDRYPHSHPGTLARHAVAVGHSMGMDDKALRELQYCALLHDVGKTAVPGAVLDKTSPLRPEELDLIRRHTVAGERLIAEIPYLRPVARTVRSTHERWDGRGYPDGLNGEQIPLASRIVHACDAFEALTHDRPYRAALTVEEALTELRANVGTQFDPEVIGVFVSLGALAPSTDDDAAAG